MTKMEAKAISDRVITILTHEFGSGVAVDFVRGNVSETDATLSFKFTPGGNDAKFDAARSCWRVDCQHFGLLPEHFGRRIKLKTFPVIVTLWAINYRAPKFPVECRGDNGKHYRITKTAALRALANIAS